MPCPILVSLPTHTRMSGGSSDTEVKEFAVIARNSPSMSIATTVTPVTNCPTVCRSVRPSTDMGPLYASLERFVPGGEPLEHHADVVGLHHVRGDPAIEVVFGHALLGKALVARGRAGDVGH